MYQIVQGLVYLFAYVCPSYAAPTANLSLPLNSNITLDPNLTVGRDPVVLCSIPTQRVRLKSSIIDMQYNAQQALENMANPGPPSPSFTAMFKSLKWSTAISSLFFDLGSLSLSPQGRPIDFVCINTQQDAASMIQPVRLASALWAACQKPAVHSVDWLAGNRMFLCTSFFSQVPIETLLPEPERCPAVQGNQFVDNPRGERFVSSQAAAIMNFGLEAYANARGSTERDYVKAMNNAVGFNEDWSKKSKLNYMVFTYLVKNRCSDVPNPFAPPWTTYGDTSISSDSSLSLDPVSTGPVQLIQGSGNFSGGDLPVD